MAGHFLLSKDARDFTVEGVERMSEREVHKFFVESRWGKDGVQICPGCGTIDSHYWVKTRRQWRCKDIACGRSFSITSDTKFADHKLPLKKLLKAFVIFANNVKGISASALARTIGVAYQTAFVLLHKIRESIMECWNDDQLDGLVHIDGAYVSGRIRKPRVKKKATETQHRDKKPQWQSSKHPNQRVVMVMREVDPEGGVGAIRTIVHVVRAEDARTAEELAKIYIKRDAKVMTDEAPAYSSLIERYDHLTVNHSKEFSTDDGVNNNQAESFFARMRRMVIGQVHRVTPKYMLDYVTEVAWREDVRRTPTSKQVGMLANAVSRSTSKWWRGYWQMKNRPEEILFVPSSGPASQRAARS
jgi:transposase-like protein